MNVIYEEHSGVYTSTNNNDETKNSITSQALFPRIRSNTIASLKPKQV